MSDNETTTSAGTKPEADKGPVSSKGTAAPGVVSGESSCPFEVGQWVTDGEDVGRITSHATIAIALPNALGIAHRETWTLAHRVNVDWSRWTAFDPADIGAGWHQAGLESDRAEAAEARVEELEDELASAVRGEALSYVKTLEDRAARAEARVAELEPPPGHVAVMLPREDAKWWSRYATEFVSPTVLQAGDLARACDEALRALEADDER